MNPRSDSTVVPLTIRRRKSSASRVVPQNLDTNMRIVFVNPNLRPNNPTGKFLPVGLAYVMTVFKEAGVDYDLLDICLYDHSDEHVEDYFIVNTFDVVLIGSIVTHYKWMKWFVHMVKRHQPNCTVIVGNSVAGSISSLWMENTPTDYVVTGEGEWAALDIVSHLETGTPANEITGITFRNDDGLVVATGKRPAVDIRDVPMIDWTDFDVAGYLELQKSFNSAVGIELENGEELRVMPVSTARGCVFKCTFCHFVYFDDPYRHREPKDIIEECRRNIDTYNANYINFWDDLTFHSIKSAERVADAILDSGLKFFWSAAIRADLFGNPQFPEERRIAVAHKFRQSGCVNVGFSLESGNKEILEMMDKRIDPEYFDESIRVLRTAGITFSTSVVFGYPIETAETIQETFDQCARNEVFPSIGVLLPLPYTPMYEYAKNHGYITDEDRYLTDITERQDICLNLTGMSDDELLNNIQQCAESLNTQLGVGLDDVFRTGGERRHTRRMKVSAGDDRIRRNANDFSFNYSGAAFNEQTPSS